ncbi:MAG: Crp/Fnr family transcriptional regulator [Desulfohalobiaceae bacterium]
MQQGLAQIPLFAGLPKPQLQKLARIAKTKTFQSAEIIFQEGQTAVGFYILLQGRVKIFKLSLEGKEQILHLFGPGEPFGEVPVFAGEKFPANAQAMQQSTMLFLARQDLLRLITQDPSLSMNMLAVLSRRLRDFTRLIEDLALKEIPQRLAAYLLHLQGLQDNDAQEHSLSLDVSKGTLAKILGTSQETLSRTFNRLAKEGLVEIRKKNILIQNQTRLTQLSNGEFRLGE